MKTILFNYADLAGGAAIASYRIHQSLRHVGVDSSMWVNKKLSDDWTVSSNPSKTWRLQSFLRSSVGRALPELCFRDADKTYRSYSWLPSQWAGKLNNSSAQLVHLVWVNGESLSVADIKAIRKPKIMTLQDMWAFCGAEHYSQDVRYQSGYRKDNVGDGVAGVDIDRWVWNRKRKHWQEPFQLVAISEWLAQCIRQSALFAEWPVSVIPNPVDTSVWKPLDRHVARRAFNLPEDKKIILFGALGGTSNPRKGYAYLDKALDKLASERRDVQLVVYGQSRPRDVPESPFPITYVGKLNDPLTMCMLNNAADVFVTPAIQEAFGQTASEAQACGLPVVAFADTGIADIVEHKRTGYLAALADAGQLAEGVQWVLDCDRNDAAINSATLRENSRHRALAHFAYDVVGQQYQALYASVMATAKP